MNMHCLVSCLSRVDAGAPLLAPPSLRAIKTVRLLLPLLRHCARPRTFLPTRCQPLDVAPPPHSDQTTTTRLYTRL